MPFIPHTEDDVTQMLQAIGVDSIHDLFDEIPTELQIEALRAIPEGLTEMQLARLVEEKTKHIQPLQCFIGAGAYDHHIPAAVWSVASRGEFLTAYTPYQAEASQGTLQLIYEYQTMMARLTQMDASNASVYDGATALAESILMALRLQRPEHRRALVPRNLHPHYRQVLNTVVTQQNIELIEIPYDAATGQIDFAALETLGKNDFFALVIQHPNFFGQLEEIDTLTDWAHQKNATVIGVVNPTSLGLLKPPGEWGTQGADIACGEGQPFGVPLASGGPYFGFMCCKTPYIRQLPGRIVGRTIDAEGRPCFTLTLQAREQHIRRAKATSNICTNQGLLVTAATIYMSLVGAEGLRRIATHSHQNMMSLKKELGELNGVSAKFDAPCFHESVIQLDQPVEPILKKLASIGILGGYPLERRFPELKNCILICTTETKTPEDLKHYVNAISAILEKKDPMLQTATQINFV